MECESTSDRVGFQVRPDGLDLGQLSQTISAEISHDVFIIYLGWLSPKL